KDVSGRGRKVVRFQPDRECAAVSAEQFAKQLPKGGQADGELASGQSRGAMWKIRSGAVRPSHGWKADGIRPEALVDDGWLLVHWPEEEANPTKYWFSNLPSDCSIQPLIGLARLRWGVERDYREGKGLAGLDHLKEERGPNCVIMPRWSR